MVTNMALHFENVLEARPRHLATPSILHLPTVPSDHHTLGLATLWHLLWYNVISMASSDTTILAPARIFQAA
jgi:hypothetical protein